MARKRDIWEVQKELQKTVGATPVIEVAGFSNWASTQVREQILAVSPTTVEEVQAVVRGARALLLRVRAAGRKHSWTPLFSDKGDVVMYVKDLQRPDGPQIELPQTSDGEDYHSQLVTIATGVTVKEFMDFELSAGVCIPANVILRVVQMGGVVAPACHGVGWDVKTVSDDVVAMRIVDSDGNLRTYSLQKDPEMMRAVQANLGLWGIIVDLTLKVSPMPIVETKNVWMTVDDIFYDKENLRKIVTENMSVEIFWFPFNSISSPVAWKSPKTLGPQDWHPKEDKVWLRLVNQPDHVGPVEGPEYYDLLNINNWLQELGLKDVEDLITDNPHITPGFPKTQVQQLEKAYSAEITQQLPHAIHYRGSVQDVPVYDMEWAIPIDEDFSNICTAIQHVIEVVQQEAQEGRFPLNLPLEMRFIADSDVYMAPCGGSNPEYGGIGHTCMMEVLTPGWEEFCQKVANVWAKMKGARPHWCKEWQFLEGIDDFLRESYKPVMSKYLAALERSGADPDRMFFNDRLEKIFHPGQPLLLRPGGNSKAGADATGSREQGEAKGAGQGLVRDKKKPKKSGTCQLF